MRLDGMTYEAIAKAKGITRQRVQQLISPPPQIRKYIVEKADGLCEDCGILVGNSGHIHHEGNNGENYNDIENLKLLCISCHRAYHPLPPHSKAERNKKLYQFFLDHPTWTIKSIASIYHISQPRAWLIIQQEKGIK